MSEADHAKRDGASLQPNSGRGTHAKGDAVLETETGTYVVDYKEYARSFSLSPKVWAKVSSDAMAVDFSSEPTLKVVFDNGTAVAVIDWSWFMALANKEV